MGNLDGKKKFLMRGMTGTVCLLTVGAIAVIATGLDGPQATPVDQAAAKQIVLDSGAGETFTPSTVAPEGVSGSLITEATARIDAAKYAVTPPSDAIAQTGYFTFPVGPGDPDKYLAKDTFVYAFHWTECGPALAEVLPDEGQKPPPSPAPKCTEWVIVDAATGDPLDITWN